MRTPFRLAAALSAGLALFVSAAAGAAETAMDEAARMQYAVGYQIGRDLAVIDARPEALAKGIEHGRSGAKPLMTEEEMNAAFDQFAQLVVARQVAEQAAERKAFLDANAKKPGVKTTASGLQYRMISEGKGRKPAPTDVVTVNYRGTLVNGAEFDSSYKRNEPASFPLDGVIAGWTEGLQLMPVGSKFELVVPPELAYGPQGPLGNQILVFEVELLDAKPGEVQTPGPVETK